MENKEKLKRYLKVLNLVFKDLGIINYKGYDKEGNFEYYSFDVSSPILSNEQYTDINEYLAENEEAGFIVTPILEELKDPLFPTGLTVSIGIRINNSSKD